MCILEGTFGGDASHLGPMVACALPQSHPRVSVLIPTHNYGRFLWQAIESVLAQDFTDFELIISDDASTDDSAEIIAEYAHRDSRIRACVHRTNLGMVDNWNWCLHEARGEYVKFVFGDDSLVERDALSRMVAALDAAPNATMVAAARLLVNQYSRPVAICNDLGVAGTHPGAAIVCRCMRENRNVVGEPSAVMFRREAGLRGFDPTLRQIVDLEFWNHLLLQGDLVYLPTPLCAFRLHGTQQTVANRRVDLGPMESLLVMARYIDAVSSPTGGGFSPWQGRRALFERLYYSRKYVARSVAILVGEAAIRARLTLLSCVVLWTWHKAKRPFQNLRRFFRRRVFRRPQDHYTDFEALGNLAAKIPPDSAYEAAWTPGTMTEDIATRRQLSPVAHSRGSRVATL